MEYKSIELFIDRVAHQVDLGIETDLTGVKFKDRLIQDMTGARLATLSYFLTRKDEQEKTIEHETPANAWQMFKKDHMPKWFIKRFPIKNEKWIIRIVHKVRADFLKAHVDFKEQLGEPVVVRTFESYSWNKKQ